MMTRSDEHIAGESLDMPYWKNHTCNTMDAAV